MEEIALIHGGTYEEFVSQFQKYITDKIICISNGVMLVIESADDIPQDLRYIDSKGDIHRFTNKEGIIYNFFGEPAKEVILDFSLPKEEETIYVPDKTSKHNISITYHEF